MNKREITKRLDENNRTEKYWTATVLTSLIADEQFTGVPVFLNLLKNDSDKISFKKLKTKETIELDDFKEKKWGYDDIQISTELWHARDFSKNEEFAVPDLILLIRNKYLIICEAKFFQRVKVDKVVEQVSLQKKSMEDIMNTHPNIEFFHHCFIHGGSEEIKHINGIDSIITWEQICNKFQITKGNDHYFVKVLSKGLENYKKEFPKHNKQDNYYSNRFDFIDLIIECGQKKDSMWVGLGSAGRAEDTLKELINGAKEELKILQEEHIKNPQRFMDRPEFLKDKKYKHQSSLEYLFKHSNKKYKIDYAINGSGDCKSDKPNWINGCDFLQALKSLIK